ncbi:MAG: porin [Pseudomonadota bacterium]
MINPHEKLFRSSAKLILFSTLFIPILLSYVYAADFSARCCEDLEERVKELEATTVRKGNRKISLKLSGHVNQALLIWDDGDDTDIFIGDVDTFSTRFRFTGTGKIKPGWRAGFIIELEVEQGNTGVVTQLDDDGRSIQSPLGLRHADLWIKSRYGKISLGQGFSASDLTSEIDLSGTNIAGKSLLFNVGGGFFFINSATQTASTNTIRNTYNNLDGLGRNNRIRYDTPTLAGFIFSTSFAENDAWDFVLRYKNKIKNFKVAGAISYSEDQEVTAPADYDRVVNGSLSISHMPTGLNVTVAAGDRDDENTFEQTFYYGKIGIKRKLHSFGHTAFAIDYGYGDEFRIEGGEFEHFGIHVVQNIDPAAVEIFFSWSHNEYDTLTENFEDLDFFLLGSRIKF